MQSAGEFDYVVVGAGSSGCVVATRLSESGKYSVALIEAGGKDDSFWFRAPLGFGKLYDHKQYNWGYEGESEPHLSGARTTQPRGKVLGGTSSINGMLYMRGQREDYEHWRQLGCVGWDYEDVLPYFKKAEDNDRGASEFHNVGGPLTVSTCPRHELADAFISAAEQAGYPRNDDFNGARQEGFGYNQATIRNGERCSTAMAYLKPARARGNLSIITNALATRILFKDGQATGVEIRRAGKLETVTARREVISSGGTFNSPQLLQLSGLGPGALLQQHGIPVLSDLKGVGENLQDHFAAAITYKCSRPVTVNDEYNNLLKRYVMGAQYLLLRTGMMACTATTSGGCIRTDTALDAPDVRLVLQLWSRSAGMRSRDGFGLYPFSSFGVCMNIWHPDNRGHVRIKSPDPATAPEMLFNFFASERDRNTAVAGLRAARKVMSQPAISKYVVEEHTPGLSCSSDTDWIDFCHQHGRSNHHPTSTCKMGVDDMAVVDPRLRVRGVGRLRVADCSIMPRIVAGNTNAPAIMIGEKCAAMMLEDAQAS